MSFALDQAFVQISFKDTGVASGLAGIKRIVESSKASLAALSGYAKGFLAIAGAGAAYAVKEYIDMERQEERLRSALAATGQEVDANYKRLNDYADALSRATVYDEEAIKGTMAFATNLGVTAENLEQVTKLGIGLSEAFGLNLEEGVRAAALAQQGNTRALRQMIPALKSAKSEQDALNLVVKRGEEGFKEAEDRTGTLQGQIMRLHVAVSDVARAFGDVLAPQVAKLTDFLTRVARFLQSLSPQEKQQIVLIGEWAMALAAVVAFGPAIATFAGTVLSAISGMVSGITSMLVFLVTTPFGLVITGLTAIAMGFAYAIGEGNGFVERIVSGFVQIVSFMDHMLGSWEGLNQGMEIVWSQLAYFLLECWINVKNYLMNGWEYLCQFLEQAWWDAFEGMYGVWGDICTGSAKAVNWLKRSWSDFTDWLGDKFAAMGERSQAESYVRENWVPTHKGATEDQIQAEINRQAEDMANTRHKIVDGDFNAREQEYNKKQNLLDKELNADKDVMHKQVVDQKALDLAKRQGNRSENDKQADSDLGFLETDRQKSLADQMDKLNKLPTLSGKIKEAFKGLWSQMGLPDIEALQKKFNNLKVNPDKMDSEVGSLKVHSQKATTPTLQGIDQTFKQFSALRLLGIRQTTKDNKERIAEQQLKSQQNTEKHAGETNILLKQYLNQGGTPALWG